MNIVLKSTDSKVFTVLVTFHPDLAHLGALIDKLYPQVSKIIVVDNGSTAEAINWLQGRAELDQIKLVSLNDNFGIAAAQNHGIKLAVAASAGFVLLMDQDSLPCSNMVEELRNAAISLASQGHSIAAVGPIRAVNYDVPSTTNFHTFDRFPPKDYRCSNKSDQIPADMLIASGMLIPVSAFKIVGLMNEAFFIDHVDTDWCFRARSSGMRMFGICSATLIHKIGLRNARIWFGRWRTVFTHSPIRNYYFMRNSLVLIGRNYTPPFGRLFLLYFLAGWTLRTVFLSPRGLRLRMILKGLFHAIKQRLGPL